MPKKYVNPGIASANKQANKRLEVILARLENAKAREPFVNAYKALIAQGHRADEEVRLVAVLANGKPKSLSLKLKEITARGLDAKTFIIQTKPGKVVYSYKKDVPGVKEANDAANKEADKILGKRSKFKLKKKPEPPDQNLMHERCVTVWDTNYLHKTLKSFVSEMQAILREYPDASIETELDYGGCYYESDRPSTKVIVTAVKTVTAQYDEAYDKYLAKLEKYNEWYEANKAKVDEELAFREAEEIADIEKRAKRHEAKAAKLRKKLNG